MRTSLILLLVLLGWSLTAQDYALVIHGGAGNGIRRENMTAERQKAYQNKLTEALDSGYAVLESGGAATDAVMAAITAMENSPLFNAGRGSVLTWEGEVEMDASIMDGRNHNAGAVTGIQHVKNPILVANRVMLFSPHVFFSGHGAEVFAREQDLELRDSSYFITEKRRASLKRYKARQLKKQSQSEEWKKGTVGCVALDKDGNLAAGTSTGGMTGKKHGRIGDSPVIGAGTYASNESCAISCTGHGEYFIRYGVARDIHARMVYQEQSLQAAADTVIHSVLAPMNADGGLIGISKDGEITMSFNTNGMFRGYRRKGENAVTRMFTQP